MNYILCAFGVFAIVQATNAHHTCPSKCKDSCYKPSGKYCYDNSDYFECTGGKNGPNYYDNCYDYEFEGEGGRKCFKKFVVEEEIPCPNSYGKGKFGRYDGSYDDGYCKCKYDDDYYGSFGPCGKPKKCKNICKPDVCEDVCKKPCSDKVNKCKYSYDKCGKHSECKPKPCKPNCNPGKTVTVVINGDGDEGYGNASPCVKPCAVSKPCSDKPTVIPVIEEDCYYPTASKPYYPYPTTYPSYPATNPSYPATYPSYSNYKYPCYSYPTCESYC